MKTIEELEADGEPEVAMTTTRPPPGTERIKKLDAARRQLQTAIWLRFRGGDLAAIHALTAAAYEIIERLNSAAGGQAMLKGLVRELGKLLPKKDQKHLKLLNAPEAFLKHAARDPRESHDFDPRWTDGLMFEAATRYANLDRLSPLLKLYVTWYAIRYRRDIDVLKQIAAAFDLSEVPEDPVEFLEQFAEFELPKEALTVPPSA